MNENVKKFCDKSGLIKLWPTKQRLQKEVIKYLSTKFIYNKIYTEKEINYILNDNHTFNDSNSLRRFLIDNNYINRTKDGSKYWKTNNYLEKTIETTNLLIKDCILDDLDRLNEINENVSYIDEWTGTKHNKEYIINSLTEGDLPPNGHIEFYKLKKIIHKESFQIIGFIELYLGYPNNNTLWISTLFIDKIYQNLGLGIEIINEISNNTKNYDLDELAVGVHLKNWPALRFWYKCGFSEIGGIFGDRVFSANSYSIIQLKKRMS